MFLSFPRPNLALFVQVLAIQGSYFKHEPSAVLLGFLASEDHALATVRYGSTAN